MTAEEKAAEEAAEKAAEEAAEKAAEEAAEKAAEEAAEKAAEEAAEEAEEEAAEEAAEKAAEEAAEEAEEEAEEEAAEAGMVPITMARVELCRGSAAFWARHLPRYANHQQRRADQWALSAGILASITGLAIWPVIQAQASGEGATSGAVFNISPDVAAFLITFVAFLSAICALVPRIQNYGERAGLARELSSRYGTILGDLTDLAEMNPLDQQGARAIIRQFEDIKAKKDLLRGLPIRSDVEAKEKAAVQGR